MQTSNEKRAMFGELLAQAKGRRAAIQEIRQLVAREYSTRENIDLEEHLRRLWLMEDREVHRAMDRVQAAGKKEA